MDAFLVIDAFAAEHGHTAVFCAFLAEKDEKSDLSFRLDAARRRLVHWYHKVVYFHRFGLLHPRYFKEFPGPST